MNTDSHQYLCRFVSTIAVLFGAIGMAVSFLYLASASFEDIIAGTSGFVAGSVLVGSGVLSLSMLARTTSGRESLGTTP